MSALILVLLIVTWASMMLLFWMRLSGIQRYADAAAKLPIEKLQHRGWPERHLMEFRGVPSLGWNVHQYRRIRVMTRLLLWGSPPEFTIEREALKALARYRIVNAVMFFLFSAFAAFLSSKGIIFFIVLFSVGLCALRAGPWGGNIA